MRIWERKNPADTAVSEERGGGAVSEGLQLVGRDPHWSSSGRATTHGKDSCWILENCLLWKGLHAGAGEECGFS